MGSRTWLRRAAETMAPPQEGSITDNDTHIHRTLSRAQKVVLCNGNTGLVRLCQATCMAKIECNSPLEQGSDFRGSGVAPAHLHATAVGLQRFERRSRDVFGCDVKFLHRGKRFAQLAANRGGQPSGPDRATPWPAIRLRGPGDRQLQPRERSV